MRIALCDDRREELDLIHGLLADYEAARSPLPLEISRFSNGRDLLEAAKAQRDYDLYMLDVLMPELGGIVLAEQLGALGLRPYIVFLTTSPDFALEAFSVHARNYLLKPVTRQKLFSALDTAVSDLDRRVSRTLTISEAENRSTVVLMESIVYAEGRSHVILYHLNDGRTIQSRSVREPFARSVQDLLESGFFMRPHHSFVVNMNEIRSLSSGAIHLSGGGEVPLARSRLASAKTAYLEFLSHQG